jgi:hypothetical protein
VGAAIADARKEADIVVEGKATTVVGYVDEVQGYVGNPQTVISQASNFASFGKMLDKIDVFVKIVDKTTSVCGRVCICVIIGDTTLPRFIHMPHLPGASRLRCTR